MKRLLLFYNPASGRATFRKRLDFIIQAFQKRGIMLIPFRTSRENEDFPQFLEESGAEGILAAGGDGTLSIVVNLTKKLGYSLPIGIIGSGTSNDFASYLGTGSDLEAYFDSIAAGNTQAVDLGLAEMGTKDPLFSGEGFSYFVNVASAGMFSAIAHEVNTKLKNTLGKGAYYLKGLGELTSFRTQKLTVTADGRVYQMEALIFVVLNTPAVGSMKCVAEGISPTDGLMDFLAVKKTGPKEFMKICGDLLAGSPIDGNPAVLHICGKNFRIESETPIESDLDGEKGPPLPLVIKTLPKALNLYRTLGDK